MIKKTGYALLEALYGTKGLGRTINGVSMKLPVKYFRYFPSDYEMGNFQFLKENCHPGNIVLDIGAHIGVFAVAAAKYVGYNGKVFAFEPTPGTNKLLTKTIQFNKLEKVIFPRSEAIGMVTGKTNFFISDLEGYNSNTLISYIDDRVMHSVEINVITVDGFVEEMKIDKINFLKIDAEGAELDVMKGAIKTFQHHRPITILAIHPDPILAKGDRLEDIYDLLLQLNYNISYNYKPISKDDFCKNRELIDLHLLPL
jgi:FkbM family methyltransferase